MLKFKNKIILLILIALQTSVAGAVADDSSAEMGHIDGDIFGKKTKWYQLFVSLSEVYDDNVFNAHEDKEEDFISTVSPGIQLAVPEVDQAAEEIVTDTAVTGGRVFDRFRQTSFSRFRAYARYAPWMQCYTRNEDENMVNHHAQAGIQLNLSGGLSIDTAGSYTETFDQLQANISPKADRYRSNLLAFTLGYPISEKFLLQTDYTNFQVTYRDDEKNGFGNRTDNSGTGYLFFEVKPKTALYIKYQCTDIDYENDARRNGTDRNLLGGFKWDFGAKTGVNFQAGYGVRSYRNSFFDDGESFVYQVDVDYRFSSKTSFGFMAFQRNEESTESVYNHTRTTGLSLKISHLLTSKLFFECNAAYNRYEYNVTDRDLTEVPVRVDNHFFVTPSVAYAFNKWFSLSLSYAHRLRDSEIDKDSYSKNILALKITGAI